MEILKVVKRKHLKMFAWFQAVLLPLIYSAAAGAQQLPKVEVEGVEMNSDKILGTGMAILYAVIEAIIYIVGIVCVVSVVMGIIKEVREAKNNDDGRWGRVLAAFIGGLLTIVVVMWLLNYALDMMPQ